MSSIETAPLKPAKFKPRLIRRMAWLGVTAEQVRAAMGWKAVNTFYNLANGVTESLDLADAMKLAKLLDWSVEELQAAITEAREHAKANP